MDTVKSKKCFCFSVIKGVCVLSTEEYINSRINNLIYLAGTGRPWPMYWKIKSFPNI